ncbi:UNKNOWN [Stylonychia lemnae]|uniref:Transmembrane protein n=1 Tax=Stylonychia lemnae TaxID=5949 RepID=A0A077ZTH2_STYLE|nr:UNKNOWN [Stylonychia lemnae]|eukprot:CDW73213.1 UNKNOWN [Stylonychia lemnae]
MDWNKKDIETENHQKTDNRSSTSFDYEDDDQQQPENVYNSNEIEESKDYETQDVQMEPFQEEQPSNPEILSQQQEEQKEEENSNNNSNIDEFDIKIEIIKETIDKNENKKSTTANISSIKSKDHYLMKLENQQQISKKVRNQCFLLFLLNAAGLLAILIICAFMYPIDLFAFVLSLIFQALINLLVVLIIGTKIIRKWNSEVIDQNNPNTDKFGRFYLTAIRYQITYKKIMEIIKQS